MSARRWRLRLLVAGVATALAAVLAVGGLELTFRHQERSNGLWLPHDEPGRKWALLPERGGINAQGFNERELPFEKPEGVWRVVVVGDSVTFAGGVLHGEGYTRVAEQQLKDRGLDVEILNLSVYGYDAEQVAATLHYRAWQYAPDLVVYAAYTNDGMPSRLIHVGAARSPVYVGNEPDEAWGAVGDALQRWSAVYRRWRGARYARVIKAALAEDPEVTVGFVAEHLADMKADARAHDTPLLVWMLAPHVLTEAGCVSQKVGPSFCRSTYKWLRLMNEEARALGLPVANALGVWTAAGRAGFFSPNTPDDIHHPGAEGHLMLGAAFAQVLEGYRQGVQPLPYAALPELNLKPEGGFVRRHNPERPPKKKRRARDP